MKWNEIVRRITSLENPYYCKNNKMLISGIKYKTPKNFKLI